MARISRVNIQNLPAALITRARAKFANANAIKQGIEHGEAKTDSFCKDCQNCKTCCDGCRNW